MLNGVEEIIDKCSTRVYLLNAHILLQIAQ